MSILGVFSMEQNDFHHRYETVVQPQPPSHECSEKGHYCKNRNKRGIFCNKRGFLCRQIETKTETIFITILPLVCAFLVASKVHLFCTIFFHVYSELSHVHSGFYSNVRFTLGCF